MSSSTHTKNQKYRRHPVLARRRVYDGTPPSVGPATVPAGLRVRFLASAARASLSFEDGHRGRFILVHEIHVFRGLPGTRRWATPLTPFGTIEDGVSGPFCRILLPTILQNPKIVPSSLSCRKQGILTIPSILFHLLPLPSSA